MQVGPGDNIAWWSGADPSRHSRGWTICLTPDDARVSNGAGLSDLQGTDAELFYVGWSMLVAATMFQLIGVVLLLAGPTIRKPEWRRACAAHGRAHPLCITTLGGDIVKVDSWVEAKDIHVAIARAHPELGDPAGFMLQTHAGVRVEPGQESESRSALLSSQIPLQLILIMGTPNGEVGDAPTRHISIQFPKVSSQVHPK